MLSAQSIISHHACLPVAFLHESHHTCLTAEEVQAVTPCTVPSAPMPLTPTNTHTGLLAGWTPPRHQVSPHVAPSRCCRALSPQVLNPWLPSSRPSGPLRCSSCPVSNSSAAFQPQPGPVPLEGVVIPRAAAPGGSRTLRPPQQTCPVDPRCRRDSITQRGAVFQMGQCTVAPVSRARLERPGNTIAPTTPCAPDRGAAAVPVFIHPGPTSPLQPPRG